MVMKKEQPKVKEKDLQSITDELGSFSTDAGGGERWKNLKTGAEMLNGTVLMPGEEASVHDLTAPYDEEHGYVPAGSYENGQVVDSYGGESVGYQLRFIMRCFIRKWRLRSVTRTLC